MNLRGHISDTDKDDIDQKQEIRLIEHYLLHFKGSTRLILAFFVTLFKRH